MRCAVKGCNNNNNTNNKAMPCKINFFSFPTNPALRKQWTSFCAREKTMNVNTSSICMEHFQQDDFENNLEYEMGFTTRRFLKQGAIPTIKKIRAASNILYKEREERIKKRENKKTVELLLKEYDATSHSVDETCSKALDTDVAIDNSTNVAADNIEEILLNSTLNKNDPIAFDNIENIPCNSENVVENDEINRLKSQLKCLLKENIELKKAQKRKCSELSATIEKAEKDAKIHEYNVEALQCRLTKAHFELKNLEEKLLTIFTKGQITKLKAGIKRPTWSEEDIAQSITLYAASAKLYKLLYRKKFPLPSVRTLQKWAQKVDVSNGMIKPVFKLLSASTQMTDLQKICVLSFDEMKVRKTYCYDKSSDTTLAPKSFVQVAMLRGLHAKWKQPVFYDFDCKMTAGILSNLMKKLKSSGYSVVAIVCDLGGSNRALFNELKITEETPWFLFNDQKVFVFADIPHLIKLLRNHFIDNGFLINGKVVKSDIISKLLEVSSGKLSITHKISHSNLNVANTKRQKVKLATKLFSHTVAQSITRAASLGYLEGLNWAECHKLFKLTNYWFDLMNVRLPRQDSRTRCHAYGLSLEEQDAILQEMTEMVKEMRAIGRRTLLPFQKGIIQSNNAIKGILVDLQSRFGMNFVLTYRLNQDVLENFFGVIRARGGLHDHPDQLEFKYRLRSYILGRNDDVISEAANVENDDTPDLELSDKSLTGKIICNFKLDFGAEETDEPELKCMAYDGLENLAGYICHKLKAELPNISEPLHDEQSFTWVDHLSEGGLTKPKAETMQYMQQLHKVFEAHNQEGLLITKNYLKFHLQHSSHIDCDEKIKKLFFRSRMFFKIRKLNQELVDNAKSCKRKFSKIKN